MILSCVMTRKTKLLSALRRELRISDGLVRRLKPLDAFRVNGQSAHTNQILVPGDRVTVTIEEAAPDFPAQQGPLSILYEDDCLIALDKPQGILVHPTFSRQTGTLANYLLGHYQATGQACAVHVVTRLDRDTMGVVLFAKNAWAHWLLMEQLADGRLEKVYEALTLGGPAEEEGLIDLPIAKRPNPSLLRYVDPSGKPAQTRFRVLERGEICRLELRPLTGRTHQLRVHCAHMGFPIVGDPQYGSVKSEKCKMQNEGAGINQSSPACRTQQSGDCCGIYRQCGSWADATGNNSTGGPPLRAVEGCCRGQSPSIGAEDAAGQRLVARRIGLEHPLTGERISLVSQIAL